MKLINTIKKNKDSPVIAITLAILIALIMVITTTTIFYKSNAYATVKQIQAGANANPNLSDDIDTTSPIKATDIDEFAQSFKQRLRNLDDYNDFGPSELSNQNLGL